MLNVESAILADVSCFDTNVVISGPGLPSTALITVPLESLTDQAGF